MTAKLTEQEKEQVRYHLGYLETSFGGQQAAASLQFGIPRPTETIFLVEEAIQRLLTNPFAVGRVRSILATMCRIEKQMEAATCTIGVEKLGDITLRGADCGKTTTDLLEREYVRWGYRLSDVLGVPVYRYSARYASQNLTCGSAGMIPRRRPRC